MGFDLSRMMGVILRPSELDRMEVKLTHKRCPGFIQDGLRFLVNVRVEKLGARGEKQLERVDAQGGQGSEDTLNGGE